MADATYTNPVYDRSFPDPFVLRHRGEYWAYSTGEWSDGRRFCILRSADLVHWTEVGGAMEPLPDRPPFYWAPEVTYDNGRFYLYYSAGDEVHMHLRVAVADRPDGPFVDAGRRLTTEEFAIDAHVFVDDDGARYMFYATDFLEHTHVGTGTVVDRMVDAYTLEGRPRPVTRARFDWQVYDPARKEKGGVRWHTVEGPFVLRRKGRYYEMFSGGNWQNLSYGVSYATSDRVLADDEWHQTCDGTSVLPILRTIPDRVVGPGHNSVVLGPDGRQLYCVYHRWTAAGRALAIDRLEWVGDRLTVLGPTDEPTPAPILPGVRPTNLGAWTPARGAWSARDGLLAQDATDTVAEATLDVGSSAFAVEASVRWQPMSPLQGSVGVELLAGDAVVLVFSIARSERAVSLRWGPAELVERTTLPADFEFEAFHELRLDVDGSRVRALLDGGAARWSVDVGIAATRVALLTAGAAAEVAGVSVSRGWSDDFEGDGAAEGAGWRVVSGRWRVDGLELRATAPGRVAKRVPSADYELVVNARSNDVEIAPALGPDGKGPVFSILRDGGEWSLAGGGGTFPLGADFDASQVWQLRFRKRGGRLDVALEGRWLGGVDAPSDAASVELGARSAGAAFEHARASELPGGSSREAL